MFDLFVDGLKLLWEIELKVDLLLKFLGIIILAKTWPVARLPSTCSRSLLIYWEFSILCLVTSRMRLIVCSSSLLVGFAAFCYIFCALLKSTDFLTYISDLRIKALSCQLIWAGEAQWLWMSSAAYGASMLCPIPGYPSTDAARRERLPRSDSSTPKSVCSSSLECIMVVILVCD